MQALKGSCANTRLGPGIILIVPPASHLRLMPPWRPPQQKTDLYSSITASLLKFKALLRLAISDLILLITAIALFSAIVVAVFAALFYQSWFEALSTHLRSFDSVSTTTAATENMPVPGRRE